MTKNLLLSLCCLLPGVFAKAQTSSVELRDASSNLIGQYNSVAAAYAAVPAIVTQPYLIEITSGYTGANESVPITFSGKTGTSSANTITLRPAAGVSQVTISGNLNGKILILDNVNYHIIDGRAGGTGTGMNLKIQNLSTATSAYTIELVNGAVYNTLEYLHLYQAGGGSAGPRVVHIATSASNPAGNSNNTIRMCRIQGSRSGIYSGGTAANKNRNNLIYGCEIYDWTFAGVWLQTNNGSVTIDSCSFYHTVAASTTPTVIHAAAFDTGTFTRNNMYNILYSGTIKGIAVNSASVSTITNNFISLTAANGSSTTLNGIEFTGSGLQQAEVHHNTIRIGGALSSGGTSGSVVSSAILKSNTATSSAYEMYNNILVNERSGGNSGAQHVVLAITSTNGSFTANYNSYNSTSGIIARLGTTTFTTMGAYQAAASPNEANSNTEPVQFVSATDLHLSGTSINNANLQAPLIVSVPTDIDGNIRNNPTYRGGDEYVSPLNMGLLRFAAKWQAENALLEWKTATEGKFSRYVIERSFNGKDFNSIGMVTAHTEESSTIYSFTDTDLSLPFSQVYYRLRMISQNGVESFSGIAVLSGAAKNITLTALPVPFKETLEVIISGTEAGTVQTTLTDAMGRVVKQQSVLLQQGGTQFRISDAGSLPSGLYYMHVRGEGVNKTLKLIKQ